MSSVPGNFGYRYWAFISYARADKAWAGWLAKRLEDFRIPKELRNAGEHGSLKQAASQRGAPLSASWPGCYIPDSMPFGAASADDVPGGT